jgi:hypothetical protein
MALLSKIRFEYSGINHYTNGSSLILAKFSSIETITMGNHPFWQLILGKHWAGINKTKYYWVLERTSLAGNNGGG